MTDEDFIYTCLIEISVLSTDKLSFFLIDVYVCKIEYLILNNKINSGNSLWNEISFKAILKRTLSIYVFLFIFNVFSNRQ